jgi:hypothetical protein
MSFFAPEHRLEISQGDIFSLAPHALVLSPLKLLGSEFSLRGNQPVMPTSVYNRVEDGQLREQAAVTFLDITYGMLLTHDCEFDKGAKYVILGLLKLLSLIPVDQQANVRNNRSFRYFYIPKFDDIGEYYLDLRRISTVSRQFVSYEARVASLSDVARDALMAQLVLFLTRRPLIPRSADDHGAQGVETT